MTRYYLEDFVPPERRPRLIRDRGDDAFIERYAYGSHRWVNDSEMLQIYTGDIDVNPITEEEAKEVIERYA